MKNARLAILADYPSWLKLAEEVEPLFGPMVKDPGFGEGLKQAIREKRALCVSDMKAKGKCAFHGGIVIARETNEILWFAVAQASRAKGIGATLVSAAIRHLDQSKPISVTTFDRTIEAGLPARRLYQSFGFIDGVPAGMNPAGIPTITMTLGK